jgi:hypothetical protein
MVEGNYGGEGMEGHSYRLYISDTMSISASACAIFCSLEIWGFAPKNMDIFAGLGWVVARRGVRVLLD